MTTYAFILGRKYLLSAAEIIHCLDKSATIICISPQSLLVRCLSPLQNPQDNLDLLGGTIKIAEIFAELETKTATAPINEQIANAVSEYIVKKFQGKTGKLDFGVGLYSFAQRDEQILKKILIRIKKNLTQTNLKSRFINKNFQNLQNAAILGEKLLSDGMDAIVISYQNKIFIGRTVAIQDIESYSGRDYGRPARDAKLGMLPPKLAQIMINLGGHTKIDRAPLSAAAELQPKTTSKMTMESKPEISSKTTLEPFLAAPLQLETTRPITLYDPFCGIGTILSEGLLLGYNVVGSDLSMDALQKAQKNLNWIRRQYPFIKTKSRLFQKDSALIKPKDLHEKIDFIATESYLGPPLSKFPTPELIRKNFAYVRRLTLAFFKAISLLLKSGVIVVISLLAYKRPDRLFFMEGLIKEIEECGFKEIALIPPLFVEKFGLKPGLKKGLVYDRPNQITVREICKFIKK